MTKVVLNEGHLRLNHWTSSDSGEDLVLRRDLNPSLVILNYDCGLAFLFVEDVKTELGNRSLNDNNWVSGVSVDTTSLLSDLFWIGRLNPSVREGKWMTLY